ncbi:MAG TPA: GLUG motif-containing protein, partial [Rhizomicrobium sp.]|nr:GLUG motif-containing protein [Rhizomicrobium sp.]
SDIAANPSGFYALAKPYDASVDGTYTTSPIATTFAGVVEGSGNTISNLTIQSQDIELTGLFAEIGTTGEVRSLLLRHISISAQAGDVILGSIAAENDGTLISVSAIGFVEASASGAGLLSVGGLVGESGGLISSSYSKVRIQANGGYFNKIGGLVGRLSDAVAQVLSSSASGTVRGSFHDTLGGLVGENFMGSIQYSHADATVIGPSDSHAGGLVGINAGSIESSFAEGAVTVGPGSGSHCYSGAGGLVGGDAYGSIKNAYAVGPVFGGDRVCAGGLIDDFAYDGFSLLFESYSVGAVSGGNDAEVGGFIGRYVRKDGTTSDCYWDLDTSGAVQGIGNHKRGRGIRGLTDAQLKSVLPKGFDRKIWGSDPKINDGYPYLLANPPR